MWAHASCDTTRTTSPAVSAESGGRTPAVPPTRACCGERFQTASGDDGRTVGELSDCLLRSIVDETGSPFYGRWRLAGDDTQPILDRRDEHFGPLSEAWLVKAAVLEPWAVGHSVTSPKQTHGACAEYDRDVKNERPDRQARSGSQSCRRVWSGRPLHRA